MAGSQHHTRVSRGVVLGAGLFWLGCVLLAREVGMRAAPNRQCADAGPGPGQAPRQPEYGYLEQSELRAPPPDPERQERLRLHSYGWVDPGKRFARIPIERAMQILAEQGRGY